MNFGPCVIVRVVVDRPAANIAPCATCVKRTCMVAPSLAALVCIWPIGPDGTSRAIGRRHLPSNGRECVLCEAYLLCVVHRPCLCARLPCSSRELTAVTYSISTSSQQRTVSFLSTGVRENAGASADALRCAQPFGLGGAAEERCSGRPPSCASCKVFWPRSTRPYKTLPRGGQAAAGDIQSKQSLKHVLRALKS